MTVVDRLDLILDTMSSMQHFDTDYAEQVIERLGRIPRDATPAWGSLRYDTLIEHFIWTLRHVLGRSTRVPDCSSWLLRRIIKPLVLHGYFTIPKNVCLPLQLTRHGITMREAGDIETLAALLEEYLNLVQADDLAPTPHPFLGPLSIDEWDRIHVLHFEHHLRQFHV